jgi:endonuclease/exonuclease/phosphatase family metal-dependent hydrolase
MKTRNLLFAFVLLPMLAVVAQPVNKKSKPARQSFVAMFYNTENFYDTINDPKTNDEEFTPSAKVPWTAARLETKIEHTAQVIADIASPAMPDLVGFAEIENRQVLEMLVSSSRLSKTKYGIVHYDSPDERGIDVAMLYNPATFKVIASEPLHVTLPDNDLTRDILHVKGKLNSGEILHVFINHWPSRREGSEISAAKRMAAAKVLRTKIDEIQKLEKSPRILILGDFNDEPSDNSITQGLKAVNPEQAFAATNLYSLLYPEFKNGEGSLFYKDWDLFDQVIVSGNLLSAKKGMRTSVPNAGIFKAEYLLFKNKTGESRPNRTMSSGKYYGGYSDHLPVYVKFDLN